MRRTLAFSLMWRLVRLYSHLIICAILLGVCLLVLFRGIGPPGPAEQGTVDLDAELRNLELQVKKNRQELASLKRSLEEAEQKARVPVAASGADVAGIGKSDTLHDTSTMFCMKSVPPRAKCDYDIRSIIQTVSFTNEDGGVWKQGWPIEYDSTQWDATNKLKVFIVPHSHNDPGWIKTFEKYYTENTKNILTYAVAKLSQHRDMTFIWAEISFFARWFEEQPEPIRKNVTRLVKEGRLEFVTGGWVMNDEANTHYYAMLEQLVLGHEWLQRNLPAAPKPKNGWAIDPFGLSPTMAFLLKGLGLKNMVIQRVHYFLKKYLARARALEFQWRQSWDTQGDTDMFCHMMPFYSYDVPHTCGPDPAVCCQFDFMRLKPSRSSCPWKMPPIKITERNVASRAALLLDQYRKKAQLYQTSSVLIPLGDDFRFDRSTEWDSQYTNYKRIMDFINKNESLNANVQFGTLQDYFQSIENDMRSSAVTIPTLTGDFFTYADKNDEYWSGYYTSRPFYKFLDRRVESTLRTAEIVHSLAKANGMNCRVTKMLDQARRGLSLFQHHDGITGTAKTHVMQDYGMKLNQALTNSMNIIRISAEYLLGNTDSCENNIVINLNGTVEGYSSRVLLDFRQASYIVSVVNALTALRREVVTIYTVSPDVTVKGAVSQLSPAFDGCKLRDDLFELSFQVELRPLEVKAFTVSRGGHETAPSRADVIFYKSSCENSGGGVFQVSSSDEQNFKVETSGLSASFSKYTGLLTRLTQTTAQASVEISFWRFSTHSNPKRDKSGAYLFMPEKDAPTSLRFVPTTVVAVKGALVSEVLTITSDIKVHFRIKESPGIDGQTIEIHNIVDITRTNNFELLMHVSTSIESKSFFTDLNGFSYVERRYQHQLPIQANVYPLSAMAYIQDSFARLSLASAQPLGVSDLGEQGSLYVFLDRRLSQDDNRGLAQPVQDNIPALSSFRLVLESQSDIDPRPSLLALLTYHSLSSPALPLLVHGTKKESYSTSSTLQPCGLHLVNVRFMDTGTGEEPQFLITLHNEGYSCSELVPIGMCQITSAGMDLTTLFGRTFGDSAQFTSLSDLYPGDVFHVTENIHVPANHIRAVKMARLIP
ncbi:alpha-mannosidase 2x-like isoform X2 [Varroa jacobsoni]|uniref:Alpha-mannosidase n=2 Tax=Varroa TaxID=62624 RepID=A0A7M7JGI3_VARDE|nr:alpha-mannosidase 2x-like [Varroa destructor]XP_022651805.1 alpha-mannosidase 2x-like [Varroa destructor]XP_022651806.1 alpha-mannosidase 2x-like [Varroa destructor]XP_022651807.1 alpha-mannosidase 2x-like [Varroa destructor]XP_022651808.1 alpha-mannosidase 2x-like [Varroa destructor]XP_022651809.1 alpha-mannosidase 2x-like [Varroa destructor]XP_022651810.1 alpha-mannosidase 2x-like [Varroa destructor]XP_022689956.1 alpha-mannosidase 2x-like isoform X2 [Varroa jacobsoni]XP_022689957.1 al